MKGFDPLPEELGPTILKLAGSRKVWWVGGAVRAHFLKQTTQDFDITIETGAIGLARAVANSLGGAFYILDESRDTARVLWEVPHRGLVTLDFCGMRGPTIEADLEARDFTINALAFPLGSIETLIDPCHGLQDLYDRRLRLCRSEAIAVDPVRSLRALRMALEFELKMDRETVRAVTQAAGALRTVSHERIRDEFFHILSIPRAGKAIRLADRLHLLEVVFPEVTALKLVKLPAPHVFDGFDHTLAVLDGLAAILRILATDSKGGDAGDLVLGEASLRLGRYRPQFKEYFSGSLSAGRSIGQLTFFAALYHDVGKVPAARKDTDLHHAEIGEQAVGMRASRLRLSNSEIDWLRRVVRNHSIPAKLETRPFSDLEGYRFYRQTGKAGPAILILSLADLLGRFSPQPPADALHKRVEVLRSLFEIWYERQEVLDPPVLVNGNDLIHEAKIPPGPQYSLILEKIREAQLLGSVSTRDEALTLARQVYLEYIRTEERGSA